MPPSLAFPPTMNRAQSCVFIFEREKEYLGTRKPGRKEENLGKGVEDGPATSKHQFHNGHLAWCLRACFCYEPTRRDKTKLLESRRRSLAMIK